MGGVRGLFKWGERIIQMVHGRRRRTFVRGRWEGRNRRGGVRHVWLPSSLPSCPPEEPMAVMLTSSLILG